MTNVVDLNSRRRPHDHPGLDSDRFIEACRHLNYSMVVIKDRGCAPHEIAHAMNYFLSLGPEAFTQLCDSAILNEPVNHDPGTLKALREIVAGEEFAAITGWEIQFAKSIVATKDYNSQLTPKQANVGYRIVQKVRAARVQGAAG